MNFLLKKGPISETILNFQGVITPPCNQQQPPLKISHLSKKKGVSFPFATMCSGVNMLVLGRATAKDVNIRSMQKMLKQQNLNFQIWLYTSFFFMQLIKQDKQPTITMTLHQQTQFGSRKGWSNGCKPHISKKKSQKKVKMTWQTSLPIWLEVRGSKHLPIQEQVFLISSRNTNILDILSTKQIKNHKH